MSLPGAGGQGGKEGSGSFVGQAKGEGIQHPPTPREGAGSSSSTPVELELERRKGRLSVSTELFDQNGSDSMYSKIPIELLCTLNMPNGEVEDER